MKGGLASLSQCWWGTIPHFSSPWVHGADVGQAMGLALLWCCSGKATATLGDKCLPGPDCLCLDPSQPRAWQSFSRQIWSGAGWGPTGFPPGRESGNSCNDLVPVTLVRD